jgi:hypothetical protein
MMALPVGPGMEDTMGTEELAEDLASARRERDILAEKLQRRNNEVRALQADLEKARADRDAAFARLHAEKEAWAGRVDQARALLLGEVDE